MSRKVSAICYACGATYEVDWTPELVFALCPCGQSNKVEPPLMEGCCMKCGKPKDASHHELDKKSDSWWCHYRG